MEQILYAGNWEMNLRFPGKKISAVIVLVLCLCLLGANAHSFVPHRAEHSSGIETTDVNVKEPVCVENSTDVLRKELSAQVKREAVDLDLAAPVEETVPDTEIKTEAFRNDSEVTGYYTATVPASSAEYAVDTENPGAEDMAPVSVQVYFYGNGGMPEETVMNYEEMSGVGADTPIPQRLGKIFDGWYLDAECTVPFTGEISGTSEVSLYAGWKDLEYFLCDEQGIITACTGEGAVRDGLLLLPSESCCRGIAAGAFGGMEEQITDIYIPANITEIDAAAFTDLYNLMYIEVESGNPCYYSQGGILYRTGGEPVAYPVWYLQAD